MRGRTATARGRLLDDRGATSSSYTLQASDVGLYVAATVTASNSGGQEPATSATVGAVLPAAPADSTAPGISGTAQQGDTLTASHGVWSNNPTGYSYAWQDCDSTGSNCATIAGATSSTYKLTAADVGSYVSVTVTATNSGGSASVTSASVGPAAAARSGEHQSAGDHRYARAREHAEREQRDLEQRPDRLQLRLGGVQLGELLADSGRYFEQLYAVGRGHRLHDRLRGHRERTRWKHLGE